MVFQFTKPSVNYGFILVKKPSFSETIVVVVERKAEHVTLILNLLKVESLQEHDIYMLSDRQ